MPSKFLKKKIKYVCKIITNLTLQVYNEAGDDVTPQPLFAIDPNVKRNQSFLMGDHSDGTVIYFLQLINFIQ